MITLDLSILNQKGTPMFFSDLTANRPAAGIVGRIFIATDSPYGIFRDTGSAWDQVAGSGGGGGNTIYTADDTLTSNRTVSSGGFDLSFTSTTYIGTAAIGGGGSGKLIVGSSSADNGIQVFGANSPSIRIDNAQSGGTQRFAIGLSTATNNFIQGSNAGQFCISPASSGAVLFGMWQTINATEVMRISTASNFIIGSTTDAGQKLQVTGTSRFVRSDNSAGEFVSFYANNLSAGTGIGWDGIYALGISSNYNLNLNAKGTGTITSTFPINFPSTNLILGRLNIQNNNINAETGELYLNYYSSPAFGSSTFRNTTICDGKNVEIAKFIASTGNFLLGTTTDSGNRFRLNGSIRIDGQSSATAGGSAGLHLIVNLDGTNYKIALLNV